MPNPGNPKRHAVDAIRASLRTFGFQQPLLADSRTGFLLGGHGRVEALVAMKAAGEPPPPGVELRPFHEREDWAVPVVWTKTVDDAQAHALLVALNRTEELGGWDPVGLEKMLSGMDVSLRAIAGYGQDQLRKLGRDAELAMAKLRAREGISDPGAQELPKESRTKTGDLWLLDGHRILCGDSTKPEDVARLMNGQRASLLATDPPHLVDYDGGNHPQRFVNKPDVKDKHWDSYVDPETSSRFFETFLRVALAHCVENVAVYQWFATRRHVMVEDAWVKNGLLCHQELVWVKERPVLTRSHFMWQYEPCMYGWVEGKPPVLRPPNNASCVWPISQKGQQDGIHPTQKPVEIFARPISWHTLAGEICLEPFSGSGTQIIAAEGLGRRCYAMEQAPEFVDAAVSRWEAATGKTAVLEARP